MAKRNAPEIVTALLFCAVTTTFAGKANAALYKISLMEKSKVLSTRTIDSDKPGQVGAIAHIGQGVTFEIHDKLASCDVFLEPSGDSKNHDKADVRVSLIENSSKTVYANSGMLTKHKIAPKDQTVYAGAAGAREVTVEAPKLNRTCTVSIL